eukprot:Em0055g3a
MAASVEGPQGVEPRHLASLEGNHPSGYKWVWSPSTILATSTPQEGGRHHDNNLSVFQPVPPVHLLASAVVRMVGNGSDPDDSSSVVLRPHPLEVQQRRQSKRESWLSDTWDDPLGSSARSFSASLGFEPSSFGKKDHRRFSMALVGQEEEESYGSTHLADIELYAIFQNHQMVPLSPTPSPTPTPKLACCVLKILHYNLMLHKCMSLFRQPDARLNLA